MAYRLQNAEIDPVTFTILRDGIPRPVEPLVVELVIYLVRQRPRMVTRHELLSQVWQGRFVSSSVLTRAICLARKALGSRNVIRTVHARGYQWIAPLIAFDKPSVEPLGLSDAANAGDSRAGST